MHIFNIQLWITKFERCRLTPHKKQNSLFLVEIMEHADETGGCTLARTERSDEDCELPMDKDACLQMCSDAISQEMPVLSKCR